METEVSSDPSLSLVVLEVGCGERVPSVRDECEDVVKDTLSRGGRALLIRINPEKSPRDDAADPLASHMVVIHSAAADALAQIERARVKLSGSHVETDD